MESINKISSTAIISFFASLFICTLFVGGIILFRPDFRVWYAYPANVSLIIAGLSISVLFSIVMQKRYETREMKTYFQNMVVTDVLTCVYNRRYIDENLDHLINLVSRAGGVLTLMIIDMDYFRKYNDMYGHHKGDTCLKMIANVLGQSIKKYNDIIARYTGKEFIVVFPNTDEKGAQMVADRLLQNIRKCNIPHEHSDVAKHVTVSIGVTTCKGKHSFTAQDIVDKAIEALKLSRKNGYNQFTFLPMQA